LAFSANWSDSVNAVQTEAEAALRRCVARGAPWGDAAWQKQTAAALGLESALRPPGRPKKQHPQQAKT
jgi:putative transposase